MEIVTTPDQAVDLVHQNPPCLVILQGNCRSWSQKLVHTLRAIADADSITLVALTDAHAPSWLHQDENPGFDGFLANPLSSDVLFSLIQSAVARQLCRPVHRDRRYAGSSISSELRGKRTREFIHRVLSGKIKEQVRSTVYVTKLFQKV